MMHYDDIFTQVWKKLGYDVVYQPTCLQSPYEFIRWPIRFPDVVWTDRTIVIMHCQDFVTVSQDGYSPELEEITQHFGEHADRVVIIHWNVGLDRVYSGPCHLVYFPTHSFDIIQTLHRSPYNSWQDLFNNERTRNWQCLNGAARPHRVCIHDHLKNLSNGITSLSGIDPLPRDAYHDVYVWKPMEYDLNESNFIRLNWLYSTTKINIVTETIYTPCPGIISEKTLFALLAGQIPIVIGYPGIVEDCKKIGFDMFEDIVDTSYDQLEDLTRWTQAIELNKKLLEDTPDLGHLKERLDQQRDYIFNKWPNKLTEDFTNRALEIHSYLTKT